MALKRDNDRRRGAMGGVALLSLDEVSYSRDPAMINKKETGGSSDGKKGGPTNKGGELSSSTPHGGRPEGEGRRGKGVSPAATNAKSSTATAAAVPAGSLPKNQQGGGSPRPPAKTAAQESIHHSLQV